MPPAALIPRRIIDSAAALAKVKASLPVGKYLELLHTAALTGQLPKLDPWTFAPVMLLDGKTPDTVAVDVADRLKILSALVNKVVPDAKVIDAVGRSQDPEAVLKQDFKKLTRDELLSIVANAAGALTPAEEPDGFADAG